MQPVADAIGNALEQIDGLRVHTFVPDALEPPAAYVAFPTITYDVDMSGDCIATFVVHLIVSRAHDRSAYVALSPFLVPQGVRAALLTDRTLGGAVSSLRVSNAAVAPISIAGQDYLGAAFSVECYLPENVMPVLGFGVGGFGEGAFGG